MTKLSTLITTNIKSILAAATITMITGGFFIFKSLDKQDIRVENEEEEHGPKPDRPDLALEQDIARTIDQSLGYVPFERLQIARDMIKQQHTNKKNPDHLSTATWVERGPNNVGGRTRAIMFDPNDGTNRKVWVGGVDGGLWYTNDITVASPTWVAVDDFWANMAITCIAYDPTNTLVFYVGTGEGFFNADAVRGEGIWKTTDGGATWARLASTAPPATVFMRVQDILVDASGNVYAATRNGGVQRSTNGGTSWSQVLAGSAADLEKAADGTLWASIGIFSVGGIYSSSNGTTWNSKYASASDEERIELACAPSNASIIYAMVQSGSTNGLKKIMKSTDAGTSWPSVTQPSWFDQNCGTPDSDMTRGQAWYDLIAAVHPTDANTVYIGGVDLMKTTNGGTAWSQISSWWGGCNDYVHADQHAIVFRPGTPNTVVFGNDGGIHVTTDAGATFTEKNTGYNITQFYACAIHPTAGQNFFLAGAQDNGSQKFTTAGMNSTTEVTGGDGAFCFIDQDNPSYQFTSYVYNNFYRSTNGGSSFSSITNNNTGSFINPADYDDAMNIIFSGCTSTGIFRISNLTGSPSTATVTISGMSSTATHIRVSPYAPGGTSTIFIGNGAGKVYKVTNAHASPTVTDISGTLPAGSISCIEIGATENDLLVTYSNYGMNSVYITSNGGGTWTNKDAASLPDMPIRWALFNPNDNTEVFLATEVGIWSTTNIAAATPTWVANNSNLANVRVDMLQIRSSDKEVIAATHGRGLFSTNVFASGGGSPPVANFSASPTTLCVGSNVTFTDASTNTPTSWVWAFAGANPSSSTLQNPVVTYTAAGTFSVSLTATNVDGSDNETKLGYITVNAIPTVTVSASPSATICNGSSVTLTASGATSYSWFGGGQTTAAVTKTPTSNTTYTVVGTSNGCSSNGTRAITVSNPPSVTINASPSATICNGSSVTLTASGATSYSWFGGGQTTAAVTKTPTTASTYTVRGTSGACSVNATKSITVNNPPSVTVSASPSATICNGSSVTLTASGATSYSWFGGGQTTAAVTKTPTTASTYTVRGTSNGCSANATKAITVSSPSLSMSKSDESCIGGNGTATATPSGGISPYTYLWSPGGGTTQTITGLTAGTYTCNVTDNIGCLKTGTVTVGSGGGGLTVNMSKADETCGAANGSATATPSGGTSPYTYSWNTGGTTQTITGLATTTYTCTVTDASACTGTGTVAVGNVCGPTKLQPAYCGVTLTTLDQKVGCVVASGATNYQYRVTHPASGFTGFYTRTNNYVDFQLTRISGIQYGKTYNVEVRAYISGVWSAWGLACTLTTPATIPAPQLKAPFCPVTLTTLDQSMSNTGVSGATNYQYKVFHAASGFTGFYTRTNDYLDFQMTRVAGVQYGKTYTVEVRAYVGGVWGNYGTACSVTTPATIPLTEIRPAECGATLAAVSTVIYCNSVAGATNYQYHVVDSASGFDKVYTRNSNLTNFQLSWLTGTQVNTTYDVTVRSYVTAWSAYGNTCQVTTGPVMRLEGEDENINFSLSVYPNPIGNDVLHYTLEGVENEQQATIEVYDMVGTKIHSEQIIYHPGADAVIQIDDKFSKGVYFLHASVNGNRYYQRFVVIK